MVDGGRVEGEEVDGGAAGAELLEQTGFLVQREIYIPFPFRNLGLSSRIAGFLEKVNQALIRIRPRLFSYQIMLEALPLSTPAAVLEQTITSENKFRAEDLVSHRKP